MSTAKYKPQVHGIFDPATWTVTYVVYEKPGSACAIIDSVLDYDPKSGRTNHASADKVIEFVKANHLKVEWIVETHAHADHLTAAPYLIKATPWRQNCDWRPYQRCAKSVQGHLQYGAKLQA